MKKVFILLALGLFLVVCALTYKIIKENKVLIKTPASKKEALLISPRGQYGKLLSDVNISAVSFNPRKQEEVALSYVLAKKAEVVISIYDPDFTLVKVLKPKGLLSAGKQTQVWDGKDMDGAVLPDEAYFFTIEAVDEKGNKEVYDPTAFSGGEPGDITEADINPETKNINYKLPDMSRVLIRIGIQDGPLLNTLVDWKPRVAGEITEYWNGRDKDNSIDLYEHSRLKIVIAYFKLPDNSIITYGNSAGDYRVYKNSLKTPRPVKQIPERKEVKISPHYRLARAADYSPNPKLTFSQVKGDDNGIPVVEGKTLVKLELDEQDKPFFVNQQFEICLFLDTEFYMEQEKGYVPLNWVWDLTDVKEGVYVLTLNLSGFKDQIGVISKKIKVIKEKTN